ncbi:MAG: YhbY family RNA-binding protein [Myxococcota bacterium]
MSRLARVTARLLDLRPGLELAIDVEQPELKGLLESFFTSAGVTAVDGIAPAGLLDLAQAPDPLVPARARALIERVVPGGMIVVVLHKGGENPQHAAQVFGPAFDLTKVHGEAEEDAVVLRGTRRAPIARDKAKELRGYSHAMEPSIMIGKEGLTPGLVTSAREALMRHGLVKAKITPHTARRVDTDDVATDLAWAAGGQLVQRVGHTCLIYRPDAPLAPAVKRR